MQPDHFSDTLKDSAVKAWFRFKRCRLNELFLHQLAYHHGARARTVGQFRKGDQFMGSPASLEWAA
jgi:hypothetical protein